MELRMYSGYIRNIRDLCLQLNIPSSNNYTDLEREVILSAWKKWNVDAGNHLYGAFSFAIFDEITQETYCVRDQLGLEQLYYYITPTGRLLYSSDILTLRNDTEFVPAIDEDALQIYIMFGYPAGEKTLYKGVRKLPAGCYLISSSSSVDIHQYYSMQFSPRLDLTEDDFCDLIEDTAVKIIEDYTCRNVTASPISFLSGGVDSSWLFSLCGAQTAVGIGYENPYSDETMYAADTAHILNRSFQKKIITSDEYFDSLPALFKNLELPLADASSPAFYLGCKEASKYSNLCYSGEGPDEFFAGYGLHLRADELALDNGPLHFGSFGIMSEDISNSLLGYNTSRISTKELISQIYDETSECEHLSRVLAIDIHLFFEGDILFNLTRNAKANGINISAPFSDLKMLELSAMVPSHLKIKDGQGKYIFRKTAVRRIPYEVAFRKKTGFSVPVREWMYIDSIQRKIETVIFSSQSELFFDQRLLHIWWKGFLSGNKALWNIIYGVYAFLIWYDYCFKL